MIEPRKIHQAMQDAPHDGRDYRQARAAIRAVLREIVRADDHLSLDRLGWLSKYLGPQLADELFAELADKPAT